MLDEQKRQQPLVQVECEAAVEGVETHEFACFGGTEGGVVEAVDEFFVVEGLGCWVPGAGEGEVVVGEDEEVVLAGVVGWFMDCEGDYFGVEGVLDVWDTLACGRVVFVDLEDVGGSIQRNVSESSG